MFKGSELALSAVAAFAIAGSSHAATFVFQQDDIIGGGYYQGRINVGGALDGQRIKSAKLYLEHTFIGSGAIGVVNEYTKTVIIPDLTPRPPYPENCNMIYSPEICQADYEAATPTPTYVYQTFVEIGEISQPTGASAIVGGQQYQDGLEDLAKRVTVLNEDFRLISRRETGPFQIRETYQRNVGQRTFYPDQWTSFEFDLNGAALGEIGSTQGLDYTFIGGGQYGTLMTARLTVNTAVPEPATWASIILGFGFAGAALRRRSTSAIR